MLEISPEMYFKVFSKLETGTFPSLEAVAEVVERASRFFVRSNFFTWQIFHFYHFCIGDNPERNEIEFWKAGERRWRQLRRPRPYLSTGPGFSS